MGNSGKFENNPTITNKVIKARSFVFVDTPRQV